MLAILIPTTPDRDILLQRLLEELQRQATELKATSKDVDFIILETPKHNKETNEFSHGAKRNQLIQMAVERGAKAIAFHDDDDMPGPTYIKRGLEFVESGMDVSELWGQIYFKGVKGNPFHHSLIHKEWWQDDKFYYRMPNHLNFQKLELTKQVPFPDQGFGEDGKQSYAMRDAGIFKTEFKIPEIIYNYFT